MENWAIVVGVNKYWTPGACLKGAVNDALKIANFLISKCDVKEENLFLLTQPNQVQNSPSSDKEGVITEPPIPAGVNKFEAKYVDLTDSIEQLMQMSGKKGENLFFYFAGHGIANREFGLEDAILLSDFKWSVGGVRNSIKLKSIFDFFKPYQFKKQYFIIDACRNIIERDIRFKLGEIGLMPEIDPAKGSGSQYKFYATSPKTRAVEVQDSGKEGGAFTGILLEGLNGIGNAKFYDGDKGKYLIKVDRLFDYVAKEIANKKLNVSPNTAEILQEPRFELDKSEAGFPTLVSYDSVPKEHNVELKIQLQPPVVLTNDPVLTIESADDPPFDQEIGDITISPVVVTPLIAPRRYTIKPSALGYTAKRRSVDLYNSIEEITIEFSPTTGGVSFDPFNENKPAVLKLYSSDPLAMLEICDKSGKVIQQGIGCIEKTVLITDANKEGAKESIFHARLITPSGKIAEEIISLCPGEKETVELNSPTFETSLLKEVKEQGGFPINNENKTIEVSEMIGSITPRLSTILALAGTATNWNDGRWGYKLRKLGLTPYENLIEGQKQESGLHVIVATEFIAEKDLTGYLKSIKLCLWPINENPTQPTTFRVNSQVSRIAEYASANTGGSYWFSIELPETNPVVFNLKLLPKRLTTLVLHQKLDGEIQMFQYMPKLEGNIYTEKPKLLRRVEMLQRFYINGDMAKAQNVCVESTYDYTEQDGWELLYRKWEDPVVGLLGGYLMLRLNKASELEIATQNLCGYYHDVPDSYILRAEYLLTQDKIEEAKAEYIKALNQGFPIFSEGVLLLANATKKWGLEHKNVEKLNEMLENRIRNSLWSAWFSKTN